MSKSQRVLRPVAVKALALTVSKARRANKFTRVSGQFISACEAQFEAALSTACLSNTESPDVGNVKFITTLGLRRSREKLERLAAAIVFGKVLRHPSVGKTLK